MAQLFSRGTLTRSRWDYFERTNGWAFEYGNVTSGTIGAYFANSATGTMHLDIYHFEFFASATAVWDIDLFSPPLILTPLTPGETELHACQPDAATPPGALGMYTATAGTAYTIQHYANQTNTGSLAPVGGMTFITLPPGWAIAVSGSAGANPCELSISVWFQETLDNIAPAT